MVNSTCEGRISEAVNLKLAKIHNGEETSINGGPRVLVFEFLCLEGPNIDDDHWIVQHDGAKPHVSKHFLDDQIHAVGNTNGNNADIETQVPVIYLI